MTVTYDETRAEAFVGKALGDAGAATTVLLAGLGDRLGLFRVLHTDGPATSSELAERAGVQERYAREWLAAMAAAGYLDHDPAAGMFTLPPEHAPVLADEGGPMFFGGFYQQLPPMAGVVDRLTDAFRAGGGVAQADYDPEFWDGLERFTNGDFENLLLPVWLPAMPDVEAKLRAGAEVVDVGCGHGRALVKLAGAFPDSRYVGVDAFPPAVERATAIAEIAGVGDRVRFEVGDATKGLPGTYDVITTFDVVHDSVDPMGLLRSIRAALNPDGLYVCVDINAAPDVVGNAGPIGTLFYGVSLLYCMTTSLAGGGAGLGTCGFHEHEAERMSREAGFGAFRKLPLENPFNNVYELRP